MASPQRIRALSILAAFPFLGILAAAIEPSSSVNVALTPEGYVLAPSTRLPRPPTPCSPSTTFGITFDGTTTPQCSTGSSAATVTGSWRYEDTAYGPSLRLIGGQLCYSANQNAYPLGQSWQTHLEFLPYNWASGTTIASQANSWKVYLPSSDLTFLVPRSRTGQSGYNHQWFLGSQDRLIGQKHVLDIQTENGETWVFLDGELRAQLFVENVNANPGSTGKICLGSTGLDIAFYRLQIDRAITPIDTYLSPQPYTIYPGILEYAPIPVNDSFTVITNMTGATTGSKAYLDYSWLLENGSTTKPSDKTVSLVVMACGVGQNHSFVHDALPAFEAADATLTCVISNSGFNATATDTIHAAGHDVGIERDPTNCANVAQARQSWNLDRNYSSESFVNYFGINDEAGLQCAAKYGYGFLNGLGSDNPTYFRPTLRHKNCDYRTDILKCWTDEIDANRGKWTIISTHYWNKAINTTLYEDLAREIEKDGLRLRSVAQTQYSLDDEGFLLTPPSDALAWLPRVLLYSDGNTTPTVHSFNISTNWTPPPPCEPFAECGPWQPCIAGQSSRQCTDTCSTDWTETEGCACMPPSND